MAINSYISDGKGTRKRAHLHQRNGDTGLVVFTEDLKEKEILFNPAFNPDFGIEMAIDASFSGTPELIHDGTDTVAWTGTNITGTKVTFDSTDRANTGTKSVEVDNPALSNVWQFDRGSDVDLSNFVAISMFINVDKDWSDPESVTMYGWDTTSNTQVGDAVALEDFFNETDFDTWQKLSVPLADMALEGSTIDAIRMEMAVQDGGKNPKFYIDDMQLEEASGQAEFKVEAPIGTKYFIHEFRFTYIDAFTGTLNNNSMPALAYDKILNQAQLTTGILFTRVKSGVTLFSATIRDLSDSFKGGSTLINAISDGTNTSITLMTEFKQPVLLDSRNDDKISVTIADDLSGLISFTAIAIGETQQLDT